MRLVALAAAAALFVTAAEAGTVTSTVLRVDSANRIVYLVDRTAMAVAADVDLTGLKPMTRVLIVANLDEDGYGPITRIVALN